MVADQDLSAEQPFRELLNAELNPRPTAKVVLLGDRLAEQLGAELRRDRPGLRIHIAHPGLGRANLHVEMSIDHPHNLIVDLVEADSAASQVRRFADHFMHLGGGGAYLVRVVRRPAGGGSDDPDLGGLDLPGLLRTAAEAPLDDDASQLERDIAWLGLAAGDVIRAGDALLVRNRRRMRPKLRDDEVNLVLKHRPELGTLLLTRPGGSFRSRCDYRDSTSLVTDGEPFVDPYRQVQFEVPALHLRCYDRPVCARGQVVESAGLFLPETYRHHRRPRLQNIYLRDTAEFFAENKQVLSDATDLPGAFFHFDSEWPGHFGHTLSEQISRLWAFQRARELEPELRLLTALPKIRGEQRLQRWEEDLLATQGLVPHDVMIFDAAVRPERLYAATPMFSCPEYVHPGIAEVWDHIADALVAVPPLRASKIFCTRSTSLKRSCRNAAEVEAYFSSRGFVVVEPDRFTLAEQIALFRQADVIAGFAGSAMFTMAFCADPKTVLMISPESYTARNEYLFASVRGHRLRVAWSKPDIAHPHDRLTAEAFGSSFLVDFGREGRFLDQVLHEG